MQNVGMQKQDDDNNYSYKNGAESRVRESGLDTKSADSGPGELPDCPSFLGMTVDQALEIWRRQGAPVISLGQGIKCLDLGKLLSRPDVSPEHLAAVKAWLEEHRDGEQC